LCGVPHQQYITKATEEKEQEKKCVDVQDTERVEMQRLVGVLNCLVRGMTGARFGISSDAAVYCNAEQVREAINAWQAVVAIELSGMSPS